MRALVACEESQAVTIELRREYNANNIGACVRDERQCPEGVDSIVWKYTSDAEYRA